jgi:carbamoyltransferase
VDHHLAHITSAYFTSGFRDALVVSVDGGGDGRSSLVYAIRNGRFEYLHEVSAYNSLGNYYAYITHICGFKAMKHEGKITGLAAHGEPKYVPLLREFIDEANGSLFNRGRVVFMTAIRELERQLPKGWGREDLAASIQHHSEELIRRYVRYWLRQSGLSDVAMAGGVFANVRINEEVHRLAEVDRLFIHPDMSDGGLAVGAALAACLPGTLEQTMPSDPEPLRDVYLGRDLIDEDITAALRKFELTPEFLEIPLEEQIADLLVQGYVVARANGRMEYGPRALGNRSILYQPTDRDVNDWLNKNLRRTEFMPFAPSALYEERHRCFERVEGAEHTAEFMTITFHCTPWMQERMQGVVHIDSTARPHLVRKERNPSYYRIIEAFYRRTGLPAIINTSFNMHEEPIVCSADDCVRAFLEGNLDYLALGPYLVKHPRGVTHPLKPVFEAVPVAIR